MITGGGSIITRGFASKYILTRGYHSVMIIDIGYRELVEKFSRLTKVVVLDSRVYR